MGLLYVVALCVLFEWSLVTLASKEAYNTRVGRGKAQRIEGPQDVLVRVEVV